MAKLTAAEQQAYATVRKSLKSRSAHHNRSRDGVTPEDLTRFRRLWTKGQPFFVTGVVSAPYDGCFYEPNIWLVTPPGCELHQELNGTWKPRYHDPKGRAEALARVSQPARDLRDAKWDLEWELRDRVERGGKGWKLLKAGPDAPDTLEAQLEGVEETRLGIELLEMVEEALETVEATTAEQHEAIEALFPRLPDPDGSVVWPLYASGQGVQVDVIRSFIDCLDWFTDGELPQREADGQTYRESRLGSGGWGSTSRYPSTGSFDSFDIRPWGPLSEMNPGEHYWTAAVRVGAERWDLELPWTCARCEQEQEGTGECSSAPYNTGYRGNGGVGVFMEGGLCEDCFRAGVCILCEDGGEDYEKWSQPVAEHGLHLCEWHAEALGREFLTVSPEAEEELEGLAADAVVELRPVLTNAGEPFLPGIEPEPSWKFVLATTDGKTRVPVDVDLDGLGDILHRNGCSCLDDCIHCEVRREAVGDGVCLHEGHVHGLTMMAQDVCRRIQVAE